MKSEREESKITPRSLSQATGRIVTNHLIRKKVVRARMGEKIEFRHITF